MTNEWGVVVLPEIFGVNGFVTSIVERVAPLVAVAAADDFALAATGTPRVFAYADMDEAHTVAKSVSGAVFLKNFQAHLDAIQSTRPSVTKFAVIGFCYGGRLAYLAGIDQRVQKIVSFYGTGPHVQDFYNGQSALAALASTRSSNPPHVLSFYGGLDTSIPESDRALTKQLLADAHIPYEEVVYPEAGHAFMNFERDNRYHEPSAHDAQSRLDAFLVQEQ